MGFLNAALALASAITGADTSNANSSTPQILVDGATSAGGAQWTRGRMIVRTAGAIITAFSEPGIDGANGGVLVSLAGGAVGGSTVAQGDPQADATKGWPVRIFNASGALLGRLAAAASLPVVLSNEDLAAITAVTTAMNKLAPSGSQTAITPSDATDITAFASQGLLVTSIGGGASLVTRGATTTSTSITQPVVAGQFVPGAFSRVMAATTATVVAYAP